MDVPAQECSNGVRMAWNVWPSTRLDADGLGVPVGCLYTPLKETSQVCVDYDPVVCSNSSCVAVLNPACPIEFDSRVWTCPFCLQRNALPPNYAEIITETHLPAELQVPVVEYILPDTSVSPPVFLFVLDISMIDEDLEHSKDSLQQTLLLMPQNALVAFITFGAMCCVHEIGSPSLPRAYTFSGDEAYTSKQVASRLAFDMQSGGKGSAASQDARRFLVPVAECEFVMSSLLGNLSRETQAHALDCRSSRCTGVALGIALGLLEAAMVPGSTRIMLMVGGPCTIGPGKVIGRDLAEGMRSHHDLQMERPNAKHSKPAIEYYRTVASRAIANSYTIDVYTASLDQVGLYEMRQCADKTGGHAVMVFSFSDIVFKDSFRNVFCWDERGYLQSGFDATISIHMSPEYKCCGAIGGVSSLRKKGLAVGDAEIGEGGTSQWAIGSIDKSTTISFYFQMAGAHAGLASQAKRACTQFQTCYSHQSGKRRLRVSTVTCDYAASHTSHLAVGFDQEAAVALLAKYVVLKAENEDIVDVVKYLDKSLIWLVSKFAEYTKGDPESFQLSKHFAVFPQFMYHLRCSKILTTCNNCPDDTAFQRLYFFRQDTASTLLMFTPLLIQYKINEHLPQPVPLRCLSHDSIKEDGVLLMDAFFEVGICRGELVQSWCDAGYHEQTSGNRVISISTQADAIIGTDLSGDELFQIRAECLATAGSLRNEIAQALNTDVESVVLFEGEHCISDGEVIMHPNSLVVKQVKADYPNLRHLLRAPQEQVKRLCAGRTPAPRVFLGRSAASRWMRRELWQSSNYSLSGGNNEAPLLVDEYTSLEAFVEHLVRLVVLC